MPASLIDFSSRPVDNMATYLQALSYSEAHMFRLLELKQRPISRQVTKKRRNQRQYYIKPQTPLKSRLTNKYEVQTFEPFDAYQCMSKRVMYNTHWKPSPFNNAKTVLSTWQWKTIIQLDSNSDINVAINEFLLIAFA